MKRLLEYEEWYNLNENNEKLYSKIKDKIISFAAKHKAIVFTTISAIVVSTILYILFLRFNKKYKESNGVMADEKTKKFILLSYNNKYADEAVKLMYSFRSEIIKDYEKTGVKLTDDQINQRFKKYMKSNMKGINVNMNLNGIKKTNILGILNNDDDVFDSKYSSDKKEVTVGVYGSIADVFYDDKEFKKRMAEISSSIAHEMTHAQQNINKELIRMTKTIKIYGYIEHSADGKIIKKPYVSPEDSSSYIEYLLQPIEIEAYINGAVMELKYRNISSSTFKKMFNSGKNIPAVGFSLYDDIFSRKSKFMINMRDLIAAKLEA